MDKYIIGIDIGSSNVVMAVGEKKENDEISILGVEVQPVEDGVKDGDITNFLALGEAIEKAKNALEKDFYLRLNSAYVGISGRSVYCVRYEDYVDINKKTGCVTEAEMRELNARIGMVVSAGGDEIVQRILLRYSIDDRKDVQNPLGSFGRKLYATYLLVFVSRYQIDKVERALHRAQISNSGLCVNPTLLPDLLLTPEEQEDGVVIVDIGGDLTDISVVCGKKLRYFSSLPIGASSINNDLYDFLRISKKDINQIKHKYGSATADGVPEDTTISVRTAGHAKRQILQKNIAEIAEERLKDIAQFVLRELKGAKFITKVPCGVVLTGGSAYLSNIDQLFARELGMDVRLGKMLNGVDDDSQQMLASYQQAVAIGLLRYGAQHTACNVAQQPPIYQPIKPQVEKPKTEPENKTIFDGVDELKPEDTVETPPTEEVEPPKREEKPEDNEGGGDTIKEKEKKDDEKKDDEKKDHDKKPTEGKVSLFGKIKKLIESSFEPDPMI
jgi:cell division protein FtsA